MVQYPARLGRLDVEHLQNRDYDELVGLCKGIIADETVNQKEAEFLLNWLQDHPSVANVFPANILVDRLLSMLADQSLDREEADELLALLRDLTGEQGQQARGAMPTNLAFDNPMPEITFSQTFILTGTFQSGLRKDIEKKLMALGASIGSNVIQNPCCLIVGSLVTPAWIHSTHGRKLEKAVAYREEGHPVKIISEDHLWGEIERLGLISEESLPKSSPQGLPEPDEAVTGRAGECLTLLGSPKE